MADLISRQAAVSAVSAVPVWNPEDRYRAVKAIENLPAAVQHEQQELTADDKLAALGFIKNTSRCYGEDLGNLLYEKPVMHGTDIFSITFKAGKVLYTDTACRAIWMDAALEAAVNAKMKELGWIK